MPSLYEFTQDYQKLLDFASECELNDPDDEQTFLDTLEGLKGSIEVKADNCAAIIRELQAESEKFEKEADYFHARANALFNASERLKKYVKEQLESIDMTEVKGERYIIKVQKSGGKRKLQITGEVPDRFLKVIYEPDKDKIRKALEEGEDLNFAYLEPQGTHLRIK